MNRSIVAFDGAFRYLSNFYPVLIHYEGIDYPTVEHAYQAAKFVDDEIRQGIAQVRNPGTVKRFAHEFESVGLQRKEWTVISLNVMRDLLALKFAQAPYGGWLVQTYPMHLEEGNYWHDNFYGACTCPKCDDEPKLNWLGRLLMERREILWAETATVAT